MQLFNGEKDGDAVLCILKVGEVTDVDPAHCKIRATFDAEDGKTSDWLPVLQRKTLEDKDYSVPDIGEDVLCVFFHEAEETGFALGSFYAGEIELPASSQDQRVVKFKDGTIISYDRSSHTLKAQIGDTQIVADQKNVQVSAPSLVSLKSGENTEVNSGKETNIGASSEVNITAPTLTLSMGATKMGLSSGNASIETDHLTFKGNVTVSGNLSVKGDINGTGDVSVGGKVSGTNI